MTAKKKHSIAEAGSVLVLGRDENRRGFITSIVARTTDSGERLVFAGPVRFVLPWRVVQRHRQNHPAILELHGTVVV